MWLLSKKKKQVLLDFNFAHGLSVKDGNDYVNSGFVARKVNSLDLFDKSPQR